MNFIQVLQWIIKHRFGLLLVACALILLFSLILLNRYRHQARDLFAARQNYAAAEDSLRVRILRDSTREYVRECYIEDLKDALKAEAQKEGQLKKLLAIAQVKLEVPQDTLLIINTVNDTQPGACDVSWTHDTAGPGWSFSIAGRTTRATTWITENKFAFDIISGYRWNDARHLELFARSDCPAVKIKYINSCIVDISAVYPKPPLIPWWAHELLGVAIGAGAVFLGEKLIHQ